MDNTEKLIRAWLKCEGYEITELDAKPCEKQRRGANKIMYDGGDYKVTKKVESPFPWMDTNEPSRSAICEYVMAHDDDIEIGINDFGTLRPVLDFFNRNVHESSIDEKLMFGESIL